MKSADYYTIMESRIKYYSKKYDPENTFNRSIISPVIPETPKVKKSVREKMIAGFGYLFSLLF
jgi:hypothetical protein